jgi:signal transduction histidine kinase
MADDGRGIAERDRLASLVATLENENATLRSALQVQIQAYTLAQAPAPAATLSAHDLRTPLCTLETVLDTLGRTLEESGTCERARSLAQLAETSSKRMRLLVDDLLDPNRAGSEHDDTLVDLGVLFSQAIERSAEPNRPLTAHIAPSLPIVRGPRRDLTAVVNNIVDNAIKYSHANSTAEIRVYEELHLDRRVITISDNGCGFDRSRTTDVFEPYVRCNADITGTGLGLAIVKRAVEGWGGSVWIETRPGHGTTVRFTPPGDLRVSRTAHAPAPSRQMEKRV